MLTLNDGRSELWQWDTGRTLNVDVDCSQVHFSNKVFGRSIDVDVVDGVATIPDILLQTDKELTAWAFVGTAENGYTKISKVFKVNRRNKPADYVFTPQEQTTLQQINDRLDEVQENSSKEAIGKRVDEYLEENPIELPVTSVNGKTGDVRLTPEDVDALPVGTPIPSKTSELSNDSGFVTAAVASLLNYYLKSETFAKSETYSKDDVNNLIGVLESRLNAFLDTDDETLDQLSELVAYINSNKELIDAITTSNVSVSDIINNLNTNDQKKPLAAAQGVVLKGLIDGLSIGKLDANKLQEAVNNALAQAKASGEFDGKDGTSVTVTSVNESSVDGGNNVVTFSDGKTVSIKNGSKGSKGNPGYTPQKGVDYFDGRDGYTPQKGVDYFDGKDGYTPVKGVDYFDGQDGKDGSNGADGVGISSIQQTATSTADGGSNVFTVTLTNGQSATFTVQNGSKGGDGAAGKDGSNGVSATHSWNGTVLTVTSASGTSSADLKGDKGDKGDTGGNGPQGPAYTLNDTDKASIAAAVKASLNTETWTFTLEDGSIVTKAVYVG